MYSISKPMQSIPLSSDFSCPHCGDTEWTQVGELIPGDSDERVYFQHCQCSACDCDFRFVYSLSRVEHSPPPITIEDTELHTWAERDRSHIELRLKDADQTTIVEWRDEDVDAAFEDGFLDRGPPYFASTPMAHRRLHTSAFTYAYERDLFPNGRAVTPC